MVVYCYLLNQTKCISLLRESVPEGVSYQEIEIPDPSYLEFIQYNEQTNQFYLLSETEIQNILIEKQDLEKKGSILKSISSFEESILSKYPKAEIYSWAYKTNEAQKVLSGSYTNQDIPIIYNELFTEYGREPTNIEIENRANEILTKKSQYEIISGKIAGLRKKLDSMTNEEILNLNIDNLSTILKL